MRRDGILKRTVNILIAFAVVMICAALMTKTAYAADENGNGIDDDLEKNCLVFMTTGNRLELSLGVDTQLKTWNYIEYSIDGENWKEYEGPGDYMVASRDYIQFQLDLL